MQPTLSFEQAPPISVPYRFFLTAPLFGAVAGLVLAWFGPAASGRRSGAPADHRRRGIPRDCVPAGAAGPVPAGGTGVRHGAGPVPDGHGGRAFAHAGAQRVDPGIAPGGVRPVADGRARRDPGQHARTAPEPAIDLVPAYADQCPCRLGAGRLGPNA